MTGDHLTDLVWSNHVMLGARGFTRVVRAEPALWHARRCLELCEEHGLGDWDVAAAYEAMSRASLVAGDDTAAHN